MIAKPIKTKYRGKEAYVENPFLVPSLAANQGTKKRILPTANGGMMVVSAGNNDDVISPVAGFWAAQVVDQTKFIKLYLNGVKAFEELTSAGIKVFSLLYEQMQSAIGKCEVKLIYKQLSAEQTKNLSEQTFQRGIRELVSKNFIARQPADCLYWINPDYIFNGDRLAMVTEYFREGSPAAKEYILRKKQIEEAQNQPELNLEEAKETSPQ